jgi:hypothetical protein
LKIEIGRLLRVLLYISTYSAQIEKVVPKGALVGFGWVEGDLVYN